MNFIASLILLVDLMVMVMCQQPLDDLAGISPYVPENIEKGLLERCESQVQNLSVENEKLIKELNGLKTKMEAYEQIDEDEEEDEEDGSSESKEQTKIQRSRRGIRCDGGTLSAWACSPQCNFKLKGLCGLSLKSICHC